MSAKLNIDWENLDWSKPRVDLAKELRCSVNTVHKYRQRLNIPKSDFLRTEKAKRRARLGRRKAFAEGRYEEGFRRRGVALNHGKKIREG